MFKIAVIFLVGKQADMQIKPLTSLKFIFLIFFLFIVCVFTSAPVFADDLNLDVEQQVLKVIRKHPEVILESIQDYQRQQQERAKQEQLSLLRSIKADRKQFVGKSPISGKSNSKDILIEFSDFQCPYCADVHSTLKDFLADHPDSFSFIYKHYPLTQIHSEAMSAATASWAAQQQNKFWQFHDYLFTHQEQLGESLYTQAAKDLGLNLIQFDRDRKSQSAIDAVNKDMELAERLGISGTPFFVMGEETFSGAVQTSFLEDKLAKM